MSIENILDRIAISTERSELLLAKILTAVEDFGCMPASIRDVPQPGPEPVPAPTPAPFPPPAPPFAIPLPPAAPPLPPAACPITDAKAMLEYCMNKYRSLGPVKGGMIQTILIEMGIANINAIPTDRYAEFYAKVEAI